MQDLTNSLKLNYPKVMNNARRHAGRVPSGA